MENEPKKEEFRAIKRVYRDLMKIDIVCYSGEEFFVNQALRIQSHHVIACADFIEIQIKAVMEEERRMPERLRKLSRKERDAFINAKLAMEILKSSHYQHLYNSEDPIVNITTRRKMADRVLKFYDYLQHHWPRIYRVFKIR
jgi:hypothetical protein